MQNAKFATNPFQKTSSIQSTHIIKVIYYYEHIKCMNEECDFYFKKEGKTCVGIT